MSELHAHTVDKTIDPLGVREETLPERSDASVSSPMFDHWRTFGLGVGVAAILAVIGFVVL